jgi:hypothetical protein
MQAADTAQRERKEHDLPPYAPESYATLLRLIQVVMHPNDPSLILDLVTPCEVLDAAQTILTRWGETIRWSWLVWDDPRITNIETISFLTTTWLYHLDAHFSDETNHEAFEVLAVALSPHLLKNSNVARSAMSVGFLHSPSVKFSYELRALAIITPQFTHFILTHALKTSVFNIGCYFEGLLGRRLAS